MTVQNLIAAALLCAGFFLMVVSAVGVVRLPDLFSRLHASSIGETLGIVLAGAGFAVYEGVSLISAKILLIVAAVFLVNPVGTHLIGKAAIQAGHSYESSAETEEDKEEEYADFCD